MKKYKVVGSSKPEFMNIEMEFTFEDLSIGKHCEVFGHPFKITQTGHAVILSSPTWVLSLLELQAAVTAQWGHKIEKPSELRINFEVDLFIRDKRITLNRTNRLTDNGVTIKCLFKFLRNEWKYVKGLTQISFPLEYSEEEKDGVMYRLLTLNDSWTIGPLDSISLVRDGSFTTNDENGRSI